MTIRQKISQVLAGILMLCLSVLLIIWGEKAYPLILGIYCLVLEVAGLRMIWYYMRMARFMVGGLTILYRGILAFDFGLFAGSLAFVPSIYVLLYLCGTMAFSGIVDLLRAREAKGVQGHYKLKTFQGIVIIIIALLCIFFMRQQEMVVDIYAIGLVFSAIMRIVNAFRTAPIIVID